MNVSKLLLCALDPPSVPLRPNDENTNIETPTATDPKVACQHRCEPKGRKDETDPSSRIVSGLSLEQNPILNSKRRRGCLCSSNEHSLSLIRGIARFDAVHLERQLDELEFAPDSAPSQTPQRSQQQQQQQQQEEQQLPDEPQFEPMLTSIQQTPPPLLLPSSDFVPPFTSTYPLLNVQTVLPSEESDKNEGDHEEEEAKVDRSRVPSMLAAPLSPTMPLNSTFIARRTMPLVTPLPSSLLAMSSLIPSHTNSSILAPVESTINCTHQNITIAPVQRSVSTQTEDTRHSTHHRHHHCSDVSECPCVQIYNRSEQLFMTSMAIFFRNSMNVITPPEQMLPPSRATRAHRRQQAHHRDPVTQATPTISEVVLPIPTEIDTQTKVRLKPHQWIEISSRLGPCASQ